VIIRVPNFQLKYRSVMCG